MLYIWKLTIYCCFKKAIYTYTQINLNFGMLVNPNVNALTKIIFKNTISFSFCFFKYHFNPCNSVSTTGCVKKRAWVLFFFFKELRGTRHGHSSPVTQKKSDFKERRGIGNCSSLWLFGIILFSIPISFLSIL